MAEESDSVLAQLLEDVFARFSADLGSAVLAELDAVGFSGHLSDSPPAASSERSGFEDVTRIDLRTDVDTQDEQTTWIARLEVAVSGEQTSITAEHLIESVTDAATVTIDAWRQGASVKTETAVQRPELLDAAARLMEELASGRRSRKVRR